MLLQFRTEDDSLFIADVQWMNWARVSAPPDPTKPDGSVVLEHGKLVPMGFGVYNFEGRTPKTEGPGTGLSSIGNYVVALGNSVKIFLKANVTIKDFTMPVPISQVLYEILPVDPKQTEDAIASLGTEQTFNPATEAEAPTVSAENLEAASTEAELVESIPTPEAQTVIDGVTESAA